MLVLFGQANTSNKTHHAQFTLNETGAKGVGSVSGSLHHLSDGVLLVELGETWFRQAGIK